MHFNNDSQYHSITACHWRLQSSFTLVPHTRVYDF